MKIEPILRPTYAPPPPVKDVGEDFTPLDERASAVLGSETSVRDLLGLYNVAPTGTKPYLENAGAWPGGELRLGVSYRNQEGREVAEFARLLTRHKDGSLEIHLMNQVLDPSIRSQGVLNEVLRREADLAAQTPDGKLTLRAAGADQGKVGTYVWARYGFEFESPKDLEKVRSAFQRWAEQQGLPQLQEASAGWTQPWHFAECNLPGKTVRVTVEGREQELPIGKAFMLSACPAYHGVVPVADADAESTRRFYARLGDKPAPAVNSEPGAAPILGLFQTASNRELPVDERVGALTCLQDEVGDVQAWTKSAFADWAPPEVWDAKFAEHRDDSKPFWLPQMVTDVYHERREEMHAAVDARLGDPAKVEQFRKWLPSLGYALPLSAVAEKLAAYQG